MKLTSLLCGLALSLLASSAQALDTIAPAIPLNAPQILAQDTNGPYTLQVVRAAWVTERELKGYGDEVGLTVWVRVIGTAAAPVPIPPLTLSDYLVDGRIGRPGDLFQLQGVGKHKIEQRAPGDGGESPEGLSVWRAQSARRDWAVTRADFEFLSPEAPATNRLPTTFLDGNAREAGFLRRFSVDIASKDIELPVEPQKPAGIQNVTVGDAQLQLYPPVVTQGARFEAADYPLKKVWESGTGKNVQIPILVASPRPNARFKGGDGFGATLTSPTGEIWELNPPVWQELRPDGYPLKSNEECFAFNALVPTDTDLTGKWVLNVFHLPETNSVEQKTFNLSVPQPLTANTSNIADSPLASGEWEVLDVRSFDQDHPLPVTFGHSWRVGNIAVLLRTRVDAAHPFLNPSVQSVKDATGAELKGRRDEIRLVRRETRTRDGAQFSTYRVVMVPVNEPQSPFTLSLQIAHPQTPPQEASFALKLN